MSGAPESSMDAMGGGREDPGLLEREREVATLDEFVSGISTAGQSRIGLIEGPAGIGKTTLLVETRRLAESDGIRVLSARGSELEREFPFGVVRQLFEPLLQDSQRRKAAFAGAAAPAAPVFEAPSDEGATTGTDAGFSSLHGLYWLTLNLAGDEPLLFAVDDLHWCDRASLRFLAYLGRRLEDTPLLLASTMRPNEPGADAALLADIANDPLATLVRPGPLSRGAVDRKIATRLGAEPDEAFVTACHKATGGNPLLLSELLKALAAERIDPIASNSGVVRDIGPRAASRAVLVRLARLPQDAAKVARAVAVLGDGAELWAVADLSGTDEAAAAEATGILARAEILRLQAPLGFVHPLVRDAVYLELPPGQRELEHARAAELLREAGAPTEQVAAHLLHTPRSGEQWAIEALVEAAITASGKGATESSVAYLRRALDEPVEDARRAELLADLGTAEANMRGKDASVHLAEAYASTTESHRRAELAFTLARTLNFTRRPDEAHAVASRALIELPDDFDPDLRHGLEAIKAVSIAFGGGTREEMRVLENYRDPAAFKSSGPGARSLAAIAAHYWSNTGGTGEECAQLAHWALDAGDLLKIENDNGLFWVIAAIVLIYAEDRYVPHVWDVAQREAHRSGSLFQILSVNLWRGYNLLRWGDLPAAEEALVAAAEEMGLWGSEEGTVAEYPAAFLCETRVERGDLAGARVALESSTEIDERSDGINFWRGARTELLLNEGRFDEALESCEEYVAPQVDYQNMTPHPWRSLKAVILDRLGRTDEGVALALEEVEKARAWGAPGPVGRALRVAGELAREDGVPYLEESVSILEDSVTRLQLAKSLCAYGVALRLARRPSEAREPLRRALELADVAGAVPLAERARAELHATGARPRREALTGAGSLTPSERRVADLAVEGKTNREIAQELFVTPKTVEVHLSNAYRKLEIKGRRELSKALEPV